MLNKVRILGFSDKELHTKVGEYSLQVNPQTYNHVSQSLFSRARGSDTAGTIQKFRTLSPQTVTFDFILDATGVIAGIRDVATEIKKFRDVAYDYHGSIHSPYYLKMLWGGLAFKCVLTDLKVEYQLFNPSGKPLRAKLSVTLREHQTPQDLARKADKKSADLTHAETVFDGATLPLITNRVYDRPDLYINVARANDLNNIMHLQAGDRLRCPPVKES
ncbi:hypothetical protein ACOXXX_17735 [Thalassococcus sp. BH17M4-6]|uniref:CIS tube protein n=1 Tax=Thalassococcus sp. BH17M4-6 TaxID=3413148 RepID=UPI003BC15568